MNEKIKLLSKKITPKTLGILGVIGMVIVLLSSFIPTSKNKTGDSDEFDSEAYRKGLEKSVVDIVYGITGDKKSTVVITLESGVRYSYADDTKKDTNTTDNEKTTQNSKKEESSHITVKTADGDEKALIVTENMPEIRGVAVICEYGDDEVISEKIRGAVEAALDITSKRIYIAGKN